MPLLAAAGLAAPANSAQATTTTTSITQPVHAGSPRPSTQPTAPPSEPQRVPAANAPSQATGAMPNGLKDILIAAGLLAAIAFAVEPVAVLTRRRRTGKSKREHDTAGRARIVLADHERLIVTYSRHDDTVYVLTPPGEDPKAVLSTARLILPEDRYEDLADRLGVCSALPFE